MCTNWSILTIKYFKLEAKQIDTLDIRYVWKQCGSCTCMTPIQYYYKIDYTLVKWWILYITLGLVHNAFLYGA